MQTKAVRIGTLEADLINDLSNALETGKSDILREIVKGYIKAYEHGLI